MLILNRAAVEAALTMEACIAAVEAAMRGLALGEAQPFARTQIRSADGTRMGLMPARAEEPRALWAVKAVVHAPGNPARGLDAHQGAVLVQDGETGVPVALLDAGAITATRTAAASAVATRALAAPGARRVAILGTGAQARGHVAAMRAVLPDAEIVLWGRRPAAAAALADELRVAVAESPRAAVRDADVVCTATASPTPILARDWLKPGCHVNAVGASAPDARELGTDVIAACALFVDSRAQALVECGEILIPLAEGAVGPEVIRADLGEVLAGRHPGRPGVSALTVYKSLGLAAQDLAASLAALDGAVARGLGCRIDW